MAKKGGRGVWGGTHHRNPMEATPETTLASPLGFHRGGSEQGLLSSG